MSNDPGTDLGRRIAASLGRSAPAPYDDLLERVQTAARATPQAPGPRGGKVLPFAVLGGTVAAAVVGIALLGGAVSLPSIGDAPREPSPTINPTINPSASPQPSASMTPSQWVPPERYVYVVSSQCGERNFIGTYAITVERGEGIRAATRNGSIELQGEIPSIEDLLAEAAAARESGADEVTVVTAPADGHPTLVLIDWEADAIDDEACYEITDYRPLID
jgi:hypothetical protein